MPAAPVNPLFDQSLEKGLAALMGMTRGSAQRTVQALQQLGYIGKHPQTRRFQLLLRVIEIGFNYLAAHPLIRAANPYLSQLTNASGETASQTEAAGLDMVYLAQLVTSKFIPVNTPVGMRTPMYCTSSGRAHPRQQGAAARRGAPVAVHQPLDDGRGAEKALAHGDRVRAGDFAVDRTLILFAIKIIAINATKITAGR